MNADDMTYGIGTDATGPESDPGRSPHGGDDSNDHLALIYEDREEQLATVAPFIRQGLERGEQCLYVADDNTREDVLAALEAAGIDTERARDSEALAIHTKEDTYLDGGTFDREAMLEFWERTLEQARNQGFDGLRAAAEMTWALDGGTELDDLAAYEALLNGLYEGEEYTVLCQYNRNRFPPGAIADVVGSHPLLVNEAAVRRNERYQPSIEGGSNAQRSDSRGNPGRADDRSSPDSSPLPTPVSTPTPDTAPPVRVLCVDDEPGYAGMAAEFLERGDGIDAAIPETNPQRALDRLESESFDCIVSDYDMPGLSGLELLDSIRRHHPDLPFILVTGEGDETVASDAISAGVTDYLRKVGDVEQYSVLANRVSNAVERYRTEREIERTRRRYRRLIEESTDVITVIDEDGRFRYLSPAAERRVGYPADELVGEPLFEYVHPEDRPATGEQFGELVEGSRQRLATEFRFQRRDGSWMWLEVRARDALDDPDIGGIIAYARDVTERKERERALQESERRFRSVFEEAFDGMVIATDDARCVDANPAACELFELSRGELCGRSIDAFVDGDREFETAWRQFQNSDLERETFPLVSAQGTERFVEFAATPNAVPGPAPGSEHHLVVVRDITDRERYERTLAALHDSSRELLDARSKSEVAECIVGAVTEILSLSAAAVYLLDPADGSLNPTAVSGHAAGESLDPLPPDRSTTVGAVFLDGDPRTVGDAGSSEFPPSPETALEDGLLVPLGDHGVCIVGDADSELTDADGELVEILTAAAETALDRIDRDDKLRDRESRLEAQNRKLEQLNQLNATVREIDQTLAQADTRSEIERAVCEHLSASDGIALVSIGEYDAGEERLVAREWSGDEGASQYLDATSLTRGDLEPAVRAAVTEESIHEENVADGLGSESWRKAALSSGIRSVLSVPLTYKDISYGILTVYALHTEFFDELLRAALIDLSNRIANDINAVEHQNAVLSETTTEIRVAISDRNALLYRLASDVGCSLELETTTPLSDGDVSTRVRVEGAAPDTVTEAAESVAAISATSIACDADGEDVVEIRFSENPLADSLADRGVRVAAYTADPASATVTLLTPDTVDVGWAFEELRERYSDLELLSKSRRRANCTPERSARETYRSRLTPRQEEVLRTAYLSGFFQSPRECTGEDLADRLDVSSQTVYRHIRTAERKLFETVFKEGVNSNSLTRN